MLCFSGLFLRFCFGVFFFFFRPKTFFLFSFPDLLHFFTMASTNTGIIAPSEKWLEVKSKCPDLVDPTEHMKPGNFVKNALAQLALAGLLSGATLLSQYEPVLAARAEADDETEIQKAEEHFQDTVKETLASAPRTLGLAVLQDFLVRSVHRTIETIAVHTLSVEVTRNLTRSLTNEFKRIDETPEADKPSVWDVVKRTAYATVLSQVSFVLVSTGTDVVVGYLAIRSAKSDSSDEDDEEEESPGNPNSVANVRARVVSKAVKRSTQCAGVVVLSAALVGLCYQISLSSKASWSKLSTLAPFATLVGGNVPALVL